MNIMCLFGLHKWKSKQYIYWEDKIGGVIEGQIDKLTCKRCGKERIWHFDWKELQEELL